MRHAIHRLLAGLFVFSAFAAPASAVKEGTALKLQFNPVFSPQADLEGDALVEAFISQKIADYGVTGLTRVELDRTRKSLLGKHYHYRQWLGNYRVDGAGFVVSLEKDGRGISRVYNTLAAEPEALPLLTPGFGEERAYDIAWNELKPAGELIELPSTELIFVRVKERFRLAYRVRIATEAPFGYWEVDVDAQDGRILGVKDRAVSETGKRPFIPKEYSGKVLDRRYAFRLAERREMERRTAAPARGERADGEALVFDPDPRTALANASLQDSSPSSAFEGAYVTGALRDLTVANGSYHLRGPWVSLEDFESPDVAPSTSTDGRWSQKRGNGAFNDVMTYFHIDQSQRYMQSLGFAGETGIQYGSIGVDSNGLDGADNSHFIPSSNKVAFGWGCVDDNEDADVILHEYGHAIHYSINSDWGGGDCGAIGEGFGDYWAGSHSLASANGSTFEPEKVFNWDGQPCWPGRRLNVLEARYNPNMSYGPHSDIGGGIQSDELWSTPIFQAHMELVRSGIPREEIDRIVLESHFGLGGGLTMRELAEVTVQTARRLHPEGPHADVFLKNFVRHNILEVPQAVMSLGAPAVSDAGANGAADPGETVGLVVPLVNSGTLAGSAIRGELVSRTPGVEVVEAAAQYPELAPGASGENLTPYVIRIAESHSCGAKISFALKVTLTGGSENLLAFEVGTGVAEGVEKFVFPSLNVPDGDSAGITSTLEMSGSSGPVTSQLEVHLSLVHTFIGDLRIALVSPDGTRVLLHNRSGAGTDHIEGIYPLTLTPAAPLATFVGRPMNGAWRLHVVDEADQDDGFLRSWGIRDVARYVCE